MANNFVTSHWDEIRLLAEQGVPLPALADKFGVSLKTIYNRSSADDWLLPSRVKLKLRIEQRRQEESAKTSLFRGQSLSEKGASLLHDTWQDKAENLRQLSYRVAEKAIRAAEGTIAIESASDLKHAVHVARQATGLLDADAPSIQLSLFGGGADISGPSIIDIQAEEAEPLQQSLEDADFWG